MKVRFGAGTTEYGPGVEISLSGDEVAQAIAAYLVAHGIYQTGPRTIRVNGQLCEVGSVYVDPSGSVVDANGQRWRGNGEIEY